MSALVMEWNVLERLLLAQAVNKYGEDNWSQVARTLKQHPLLQDHSKLEIFNQKNCSLQYYLMIENLDSESPRQPKTNTGVSTQDMPKVVKLARQLYFQRVDDLKNSIKEDEDRFLALISEIDDIKSGALDNKLASLTGEQEPLAISDGTSTQQNSIIDSNDVMDTDLRGTEVGGDTTNDINEKVAIDRHKNLEAVLTPDIDSPATDRSYQSAAEFNEMVPEENTKPEEQEVNISTTEVESDNKDTADNATSSVETGTKRRHDDNSTPTIDLDQHTTVDSSPKRQRLDTFEMDKSPASLKEGQDIQIETEQARSSDSEILHPKSNLPQTGSPQIEHSPSTGASEPIMAPDTSKITEENTPDATEPKHGDHGSDKLEGDGSESVTGNESNAATPTTSSSEKRRSVSTGSSKDDQRQKSWQKNVNHLWREIANHKNGAMFMNPIKETQAPLYYDVVKYPLDLKSIKNRIRDGTIRNTLEFERDVVLMLTNSLMYNKEGTEIYQMASEMLQDVTEQIKVFKSADSNGSTHTRSISLLAKDRRKSLAE